ncbi:MAG: orotidine-5'-phosphate decarboxylase [Treponema sp.]|jgi:orotidine-5'-phosphate decarboxylase|nr:orotidine-5'-phosphate decarboxylase [Treponema sp.]
MYNMDRLYEAVAKRGNVCVGLDTSPDYVPPLERQKASSGAEAVFNYNTAIVDATADIAACFKVQIAYYEALGIEGLACFAKTLRYIRDRGSLVISDIKRGDIADTARQYAKAHFEGCFETDFVTLSPYMGLDSIEPWLDYAERGGKGAFVLMRTSNRGMKDFEYLELKEDGISPGGAAERAPTNRARRLYDVVGEKLADLAGNRRGLHGYRVFGAVTGADPKSGADREEAAAIRAGYPDLFFLIPGYGAQGGAADDAALFLRDGNGGVVNASRSILRAWAAGENGAPEKAGLTFAADAARKAAEEMRDAIRKAAGQAG